MRVWRAQIGLALLRALTPELLATLLSSLISIPPAEVLLEPTLTTTSVGLSESIVMTTFGAFDAIAKI